VVCSACGYENQAGMRFCGMCGMPLPHRPLTTPGAQSTLNYTRVPVETGATDHETSSGSASTTQAGVQQISPGNGSGTTASASYTAAETSTQHSAPAVQAPPAKELVPDISLDEYVQRFRYQPPTDPSEVTMRGDAAPIVEAQGSATTASSAEVMSEEVTSASGMDPEPIDADEIAFRNKVEAALHSRPPAAPVESKAAPRITTEPKVVAPPPAADSVASRLGLEPETPAEERIQRPRFLDINEPGKESRPAASSGTSSIVGPSFLGLSDAPLIAAEGFSSEAAEDDEPRRSHWRGWVAVAILLIFAVLGIIQWRAQAAQSGTTPLQIIKAKLDSWRHGSEKPAGSDQTAATTSSTGANSQPETQPTPQAPAPSTATIAPGMTPSAPSTTTSPANGSPSPTTQSSPVPTKSIAPANTQSPPTISNSASAAPVEKPSSAPPSAASGETNTPSSQPASTTADNTAAKPARRTDNSAVPPPGAGAPGADEMSKAKNASDSAAAAAWLWKATAKGNPEAPVQLADMYIKGSGVPRSCEQAVVLLKTAAEKENALARNRLASMYATGNCVPRNRVEAYRWLSAALAANPNSQWAQQNRDLIWNQMTPDEQAAAQKYR
jgi:hypothetical protein